MCDRVVQLPHMQIADVDCLFSISKRVVFSISKRVECVVHRRIQ